MNYEALRKWNPQIFLKQSKTIVPKDNTSELAVERDKLLHDALMKQE